MANNTTESTLRAFKNLLKNRQGGALSYASSGYYQQSSPLYTWASKAPADSLPFVISIHSMHKGVPYVRGSYDADLITLGLFINPSDLQIGNVYLSSDQYTRGGWVSTLWGTQQTTISANGSTAGFYHQAGTKTGVTNFSRKDAISFVNLLSLLGMFKNNGANFSKANTELDLFKSGYSRIINVMDTIKISYDGSEYIGEFISFTLEEDATQPYKLNYSFEYVINGTLADSPFIEGHVRTNQYNVNTPIIIGIQGSDTSLETVIGVDAGSIRENESLSLSENVSKLLDTSAKAKDQYANASDPANKSVTSRLLTEAESKNTGTLLEAQLSAGMAARTKGASSQINNIRRLNKDVGGKGKPAQQLLDMINVNVNASSLTKVTLEQVNGVLLLESNVGLAVDGFDAQNPAFPHPKSTSARGLTQVIKGTYDMMVKNGFADFVAANFPEYTYDQVKNAHPGKYGSGLLDSDPFLGYLAGAYYLASTVNVIVVRDGYEATPQISGLAYHNGPGPAPGKDYKSKLTSAGAEYVTTIDTYIDYLKDPNKSTSDLR